MFTATSQTLATGFVSHWGHHIARKICFPSHCRCKSVLFVGLVLSHAHFIHAFIHKVVMYDLESGHICNVLLKHSCQEHESPLSFHMVAAVSVAKTPPRSHGGGFRKEGTHRNALISLFNRRTSEVFDRSWAQGVD